MCEELCCESALRALSSNAYVQMSSTYATAVNNISDLTVCSGATGPTTTTGPTPPPCLSTSGDTPASRITTLTNVYDQFTVKLNNSFCKLFTSKSEKKCCSAAASALANLFVSQFSSIASVISTAAVTPTEINNTICCSYSVIDDSINLILASLITSLKLRSKVLKNCCLSSASSCNPCSTSNSCNPCNPCNSGSFINCSVNSCNPCGSNQCNPCSTSNSCNTCNTCNPCNPCGTSNSCNTCNPCNPCGRDRYMDPWSSLKSKSKSRGWYFSDDEDEGESKKKKKNNKKKSKYECSSESSSEEKCFESSSSEQEDYKNSVKIFSGKKE